MRRKVICVAFDHDSLRDIKSKVTGSGYLFFKDDIVRCLKTTRQLKNGDEYIITKIVTW